MTTYIVAVLAIGFGFLMIYLGLWRNLNVFIVGVTVALLGFGILLSAFGLKTLGIIAGALASTLLALYVFAQYGLSMADGEEQKEKQQKGNSEPTHPNNS